METKPIGLYVHIPFCVRKCNYCDFCSVACESEKIKKYIASLIAEIEGYKRTPKIKINSIFFGGGTPSVIDPELFTLVSRVIYDSFDVLSDSEFSLEINPATLSEEKLDAFITAGVNRISIGLQSVHENEMKILGRIHSFEDFKFTYQMIRNAGIRNVNVDLMYGIPKQSEESFKETLNTVIDLHPEHVSVYGLIIEEGTPFYNNVEKLDLPDEESEYNMYLAANELLSGAGYNHYEISNYAKDGYPSRHNLKYWRDCEYIGVGLSAHSYFGNIRYANALSLPEYLSPDFTNYRTREEISREEREYEYAMLRLRLKEGFSLAEYERLFGKSFLTGRETKIKEFVIADLVSLAEDKVAFTEKGFYLSNTILSELL